MLSLIILKIILILYRYITTVSCVSYAETATSILHVHYVTLIVQLFVAYLSKSSVIPIAVGNCTV